MRQSEVQMIIYLQDYSESVRLLACPDVFSYLFLACGLDARFQIQGCLVRSPVRATDGDTFLADLTHSILHLKTNYLYLCL